MKILKISKVGSDHGQPMIYFPKQVGPKPGQWVILLKKGRMFIITPIKTQLGIP